MNKPTSFGIYLAGEMDQNKQCRGLAEWRTKIIDTCELNFNVKIYLNSLDHTHWKYSHTNYLTKKGVENKEMLNKGNFLLFLCPEGVGTDHGCLNCEPTVKYDLEAIQASELIIAYLNRGGLYGTIVEIMWALKHNKRIWVIIDRKYEESMQSKEPRPSITCGAFKSTFYDNKKIFKTNHGFSSGSIGEDMDDRLFNEYWFLIQTLITNSNAEIFYDDNEFRGIIGRLSHHYNLKPNLQFKENLNQLENDLEELKTENKEYIKTKIIQRFKRDYNLIKELKQKYDKCQLCSFTFKKKNGENYNEIHHIISLSKGGKDEEINTLILCANCHKQLHYAKVDISKILEGEIIINGVTRIIKK